MLVSDLLAFIYFVLRFLVLFYTWVIFLAAIFSWIPNVQNSLFNSFETLVFRIAAPILGFIQRFVPPIMGIDFSPIVAWFLLYLLGRLINMIFNFS